MNTEISLSYLPVDKSAISITFARDTNGYFRIGNVTPRLQPSGSKYRELYYKPSEEFMVNTASERTVNVGLEESQIITVKAAPFHKAVESPVS